jgi:hypothetical protein
VACGSQLDSLEEQESEGHQGSPDDVGGTRPDLLKQHPSEQGPEYPGQPAGGLLGTEDLAPPSRVSPPGEGG